MTTSTAVATTSAATRSFLSTRRGRLTLVLLCAVAFLDFVDASILNLALPSIRNELGFSINGLLWVPSAYLLTYGGFMLLGGRAADLFGRRTVLIGGTSLLGVSSLVGGLAPNAGFLVGARLAQGVGAAMMIPAALSILTTSFREGKERNTALGAWGAIGGLASAAGVILGGLLTSGPGWRWVMFVNPIACLLVLTGLVSLIPGGRPHVERRTFDVLGAILVTVGMLVLVYALIQAPTDGWSSVRTLAELAAAGVLLMAFVINESVNRNPLAPLTIFRINGLGFADATQLVGFAGFLSIFFFLTFYMQNVLNYSPTTTGLAYLPMTIAVVITAGAASQLLSRVGTRPMIVTGALITAGGVYWLSRISVGGSYLGGLLPGLLLVALGMGPMFVAVATAANAGVPRDKAGLAASLLNASQQVGGALGLAIFTVLATSRTNDLLTSGTPPAQALVGGFQRGLLIASIFLAVAAIVGLRATNTRGEPHQTAVPLLDSAMQEPLGDDPTRRVA